MVKPQNNPFAPRLTEDGKAVSIIFESEDSGRLELLFSNEVMQRKMSILTSALEFENDIGLKLEWIVKKDKYEKEAFTAYNFEGWSKDEKFTRAIESRTFGNLIEHVIYLYEESKKYEDSELWKHDIQNYRNKKLRGHQIYHNLIKQLKNEIVLPKGEDFFEYTKQTVLKEILHQNKGKLTLFGENYNLLDRDATLCDDIHVLAGLSIIWPEIFLDFDEISKISEENLRNKSLIDLCKDEDCTYGLEYRDIWEAESSHIIEPGISKAGLEVYECFCGKMKVEAKRFVDDRYIVIQNTDSDLRDLSDPKGKKNLIDKKKVFDSDNYKAKNDYYYNVNASLIFSILNGVKTNGRIKYKKVLPLPETDIKLIVKKIILREKLFDKFEIDRNLIFPNGLNHSNTQLRTQIHEYNFNNLIKGRTYWPSEVKSNSDRPVSMLNQKELELLETFENEVKSSAKERSAKHRLGRKISEIGEFLQWWKDMHPIFKNLFESKEEREEPLRILLNGIRNVVEWSEDFDDWAEDEANREAHRLFNGSDSKK